MQEQQLLANGDGGQAPAQPNQETSSTPATEAPRRQSNPTLENESAAQPPQTAARTHAAEAANATASSLASQPAQPLPVPALSALMPVPLTQGLPVGSAQPMDGSADAAVPSVGFGPLLQDLQKVQVCKLPDLPSCKT